MDSLSIIVYFAQDMYYFVFVWSNVLIRKNSSGFQIFFMNMERTVGLY